MDLSNLKWPMRPPQRHISIGLQDPLHHLIALTSCWSKNSTKNLLVVGKTCLCVPDSSTTGTIHIDSQLNVPLLASRGSIGVSPMDLVVVPCSKVVDPYMAFKTGRLLMFWVKHNQLEQFHHFLSWDIEEFTSHGALSSYMGKPNCEKSIHLHPSDRCTS